VVEPPIIWQHVVILCLSPIPGALVGLFVGKRLTRIEVKVNGRMSKLQERVEELEAEDK
jgi:hypothetical protein